MSYQVTQSEWAYRAEAGAPHVMVAVAHYAPFATEQAATVFAEGLAAATLDRPSYGLAAPSRDADEGEADTSPRVVTVRNDAGQPVTRVFFDGDTFSEDDIWTVAPVFVAAPDVRPARQVEHA